MKCDRCNDYVDPYAKKIKDRIEFSCPQCKETLGITLILEFSDAELLEIEKNLGLRNQHQMSRFIHNMVDSKCENP